MLGFILFQFVFISWLILDTHRLRAIILQNGVIIKSLKNIINEYKNTFVYTSIPKGSVFIEFPDWHNTSSEKFIAEVEKYFEDEEEYKIVLLLDKSLDYPDWFYEQTIGYLENVYGEDVCEKRLLVWDSTGWGDSMKKDLELFMEEF